MIRVAMLHDTPACEVVSGLALGLVETGQVETTIVCYSAEPSLSWLPPEVRIHRLGVDRALRAAPSLVRYLRTEQPDVLITRQVHANFVGLAAAWIARIPPRWRGKIIVVQDQFLESGHALDWRDNKWLATTCYRFADGLIAPYQAVRDNTVQVCRLDPSSSAVVPNPIRRPSGPPASVPHPWLAEGEPPIFVSISDLQAGSRVDLLIDAFAELRRHHDARLLVVGEGPERVRADDQIRRLGLGGYAQITGRVEDRLQFATSVQAVVNAADTDRSGQTLIEAMSVGCPVVTTDSLGSGPRFVTEDGRCGLLVPRGDLAKLAEAMAAMLRPEIRARYSELALEHVEALSPLACASALVNFLSEHLDMGGETASSTTRRSAGPDLP
jgi:glycosyltransferase involved in cell wall biosynthesis